MKKVFNYVLSVSLLCGNIATTNTISLPFSKKKNYTLEKFETDLDTFKLEQVWLKILNYIENNDTTGTFLDISNLSNLYEFSLAYIDKSNKKALVRKIVNL